jgi:hypothetical protein
MAKKPVQTEIPIDDELNRMVPAGLKWLYEMEAVNSPVLQNNLYGNLYAFPHVKDVELIMDRYQRKMLIYVKFSWFVQKFLKGRRKELIMAMLDQLQALLPSFEFRIIEDRTLFDLALKRMEQILFGGVSDRKPAESIKAPTGDVTAIGPAGQSPAGGSDTPAVPAGDPQTPKPDSKE